jgi:hypothetical protein
MYLKCMFSYILYLTLDLNLSLDEYAMQVISFSYV